MIAVSIFACLPVLVFPRLSIPQDGLESRVIFIVKWTSLEAPACTSSTEAVSPSVLSTNAAGWFICCFPSSYSLYVYRYIYRVYIQYIVAYRFQSRNLKPLQISTLQRIPQNIHSLPQLPTLKPHKILLTNLWKKTPELPYPSGHLAPHHLWSGLHPHHATAIAGLARGGRGDAIGEVTGLFFGHGIRSFLLVFTSTYLVSNAFEHQQSSKCSTSILRCI